MPTIIAPRSIVLFATLLLFCIFPTATTASEPTPVALRIAAFNIQDVRDADLDTPDNPRLKQIAAIIQRMRPNIILLSEIAQRQDGSESNADRFVDLYLSVPQGHGLKPISFNTYTPNTNTGFPSGQDLDNSGTITKSLTSPSKTEQTDARAYANDCFGYGTFPGQYAMALLVNPNLEIQTKSIRTFQELLWKDLPNHTAPTNIDGTPWYSSESWDVMRLSSKNFADIPILLPNGSILHALISHPTPPAFDGPEQRNKHRNHDEIQLIRQYIDNNQSLTDDAGITGGLAEDASFVILGDLNADPTDGSSIDMVMMTQILTSHRLAKDTFPSSPVKIDDLDPTDTAHFRLRVDYVLPSRDITITNSGVWRTNSTENEFPSDHFPVWIEAIIP